MTSFSRKMTNKFENEYEKLIQQKVFRHLIHQGRNLLTSTKASSQLIARTIDKSTIRSLAMTIDEKSDQMGEMIENISLLNKISTNELHPNVEIFSIFDIQKLKDFKSTDLYLENDKSLIEKIINSSAKIIELKGEKLLIRIERKRQNTLLTFSGEKAVGEKIELDIDKLFDSEKLSSREVFIYFVTSLTKIAKGDVKFLTADQGNIDEIKITLPNKFS